MVVALENGLGDISAQLKQRGYTIVSYPDYAGVVDAFIYKHQIPSHVGAHTNNELSNSIGNHGFSRPQGVLIINATNKDISQIEQILQTRVYSSLF